MSTYKLHYFNGRARAEVSRLIFAAAGQKFEDIRYEQSEWPALKPRMPLGQMAVLEFNGIHLPQSLTIARYLAREFHLAGRDQVEQAKIEAVADTINDLFEKFMAVRGERNDVKRQESYRKFFEEELPKHLKNLDVLAKSFGGGGSYFVGNQLSWADLYFYEVGESLLAVDNNALNNYPWFKNNRQEVEKHPKIAAYLRSRPRTPW